MRVVVVGAGIGGMCAAIALRRLGHDVAVHEQVRENRPVGAAISVWANGVKCLDHLGLTDLAAQLGGEVDHMAYADGLTGDLMCSFPLDPLVRRVGRRHHPMARAELQSGLMEAYGLDGIRFGSRLVDVTQDDDRVLATFEDGSTDEGDLLIGADGARSRTREYVLGGPAPRRYVGYVNWNSLVPADPAIGAPDTWTTWVGDGKRASVMPVAGDRFYAFLDTPLPSGLPHDRARTGEVLREHFAGWAAPVQTLIDHLDPTTTNRVEIWDVEPFHTWVRGRVVLLGDAAHTTAPDIGQGGCAAMEDAVALDLALRDVAPDGEGLPVALAHYESVRTPRAADLVLRARRRSDVTHGVDPEATRAWYAELRTEDGTRIIDGIATTVEGALLG